MESDSLIIILSVGFIILIAFVCVALGTMIKIMLDVKKITELARREAEEIADVVDGIGEKMKSFLTNSIILDKIIPAILGAITVGMGVKNASDKYGAKTKTSTKKKKGRIYGKQNIFTEEEVD